MNTIKYEPQWKVGDIFWHKQYGNLTVLGTHKLPDKLMTSFRDVDGCVFGLELPTKECEKQIIVSEELFLMLRRYFELQNDNLFASDNKTQDELLNLDHEIDNRLKPKVV